MRHLLWGGASSCAGGKGEAHWAPRQPRAPPLTSSSRAQSPELPGAAALAHLATSMREPRPEIPAPRPAAAPTHSAP